MFDQHERFIKMMLSIYFYFFSNIRLEHDKGGSPERYIYMQCLHNALFV
jgi:hypothetical protein